MNLPGGATPDLTSALAGGNGRPWVLAGAVDLHGGARQVAFWEASAPTGPWQRARIATVTLDGPEDTISGVARAGNGDAAFGSRPSPIHGIPRPSPWVAALPGGTWEEVPTLRELFGGENIVSLGGLAGGPHGFTIAGTWINAANRSVATVWRSPDGVHWQRNDSDPALAGSSGELTSALDVADSPRGLGAVGSALAPSRDDPGAEHGALWESADGTAWERVDAGSALLGRPGQQVRVEHVTRAGSLWVAVGSVHTGAGASVTVWSWGADQALAEAELGHGTDVEATAVSAKGGTVVISAIVDGHVHLWAGRGRSLHPVTAPTIEGSATAVATDGNDTVLAVGTATGSRAWSADLHGG